MSEDLVQEIDNSALSKKYAGERAKRLRSDGIAPFHEISGKLACIAKGPATAEAWRQKADLAGMMAEEGARFDAQTAACHERSCAPAAEMTTQ
jgi:hypothetical protein